LLAVVNLLNDLNLPASNRSLLFARIRDLRDRRQIPEHVAIADSEDTAVPHLIRTVHAVGAVAVLLLVAIVSVSLANTGFDEEVPEDSLVASSSTATSSSGFLFKAIKKALAKHRRKVCAKRANKCHKHVAKKTAKHANA